jgi:hypothetical protein
MAHDAYYGSYMPPDANAWAADGDAGDVWVETTSAYYDSLTGRCGPIGGADNDANPKDNAWWQCDFGADQYMELDAIELQFRSSQYIDPMQIWRSNDGANWTLVGTFSGHEGGTDKFSFAAQTGRFWLLGDTTGSNGLTVRIYWVRFYGIEGEAPAATPGVGAYADQEALGAVRNRLIFDGTSSEALAPRGIVGALNLFLGTSSGDVEGVLNEKAATADLGIVAACNTLLGLYPPVGEVNDGIRRLAESYLP